MKKIHEKKSHGKKLVMALFFLMCITVTLWADDSEDCLNIADVPLSTMVESAPPLIMFLLDDSGSMKNDVLCPEENGRFDFQSNYIKKTDYWKSQYYGYNGTYYNPSVTYTHWPGYVDASVTRSKAHPRAHREGDDYGTTIYLTDTFATVAGVTLNWLHWYVWSDENSAPYLIHLKDGSVKYYKVTTDTSVDHGTVSALTSVTSPPSDVAITRTYDEEVQNFTNWYVYYRTREAATKAALGNVIKNVSGVKIGIHTLNHSVIQTVRSVGVDGETDYRDDTLAKLFQMGGTTTTPLRDALEDVGKYFDADDDDTGNIGESPFSSEENGGACQRAYVVMMTDGYYDDETEVAVGNADGDGNSDFDGEPFADTYSNTLADVAMHYYETDLSDNLPDRIVTSDEDPAPHQHMVTYTVSFGLTGTLTANDSCPATGDTCPAWTDPIPAENADDRTKIDDLWHAAVNGRGKFLSAANTDELTKFFNDAIVDIKRREISAAPVTINTRKLESDTALYHVTFDAADWSGDLKAYAIDAGTGDVADDYAWSTQEVFESMSWKDREILTFDGTSCIPFTYNSLTGAQQTLLSEDETTGRALLDYIRGDSDNEAGTQGGSFRNRSSMLGDIVNCSPQYDNGVVYVGANDGMLHAFNAQTGAEMFGYVPTRVIENLSFYADPEYTHKYFVDGPIAIGGTNEDRWLVGCLGKGGRGVYGINISSPASIDESNLPRVWEYPPNDLGYIADEDMGYTFSTPSIVHANNGDLVAIFGNGYDSPNGRAVLYIVKIDGSEVTRIDTGAGDSFSQCNGLSTPTCVDTNFDGKVDYVFAGDLLGNMWKFDLSSEEKDDWDVFFKDSINTGHPLFQALDPDGNTQPITGSADVMLHCDRNRGGMIVVFGTGKYNSATDITDDQTQSIYGIWDWSAAWDDPTDKYLGSLQPPTGDTRFLSDHPALSLLQQTKTPTEGYRPSINWFRPAAYTALEAENNTAAYNKGTHVGWYLDLPQARERVISKIQIREGLAITVSIVPTDAPCTAGGTSSIQMLNACDGSPREDTGDDGDDDDDDDDDNDDDDDDEVMYLEPAILGNKLYFSPEVTREISPETIGLHYWRMFE